MSQVPHRFLAAAAGLMIVMVTVFSLLGGAASDPARTEIRLDAQWLRVLSGDRLVLEYHHSGQGLFKPYVASLYLPSGINPLRDAPHDHLHHHSLMLAWTVNGVNFWGPEDASGGKQVHLAFRGMEVSEKADRASFAQEIEWRTSGQGDDKGAAVLLETRRIAVLPSVVEGSRVLDWKSEFSVPPGAEPARISGTEYHGLGARFLVPMDKDGLFLASEGGTGVEGTNKKRARWCSYTASPELGKKVTFAILDSPTNPRAPADWFTMTQPFAYVSATMRLDEEPLELKAGQKLAVRYGVVVFEGQAPAESIEKAYAAWLAASP